MKRFLTALIALGLMAGLFGCFGGEQGEKDEAKARKWIVEYQLETYAIFMEDLTLTSISEYTWYDTCIIGTTFAVSYDYTTEYSPYSASYLEDRYKRYFRDMKYFFIQAGTSYRDEELYDPVGSGILDRDWWTEGEGVRDDARQRGVITCSADMLTAQELARVSEEYGR